MRGEERQHIPGDLEMHRPSINWSKVIIHTIVGIGRIIGKRGNEILDDLSQVLTGFTRQERRENFKKPQEEYPHVHRDFSFHPGWENDGKADDELKKQLQRIRKV